MSSWHRELADMLTDVFEGLLALRTGHPGIAATSLELRLPLEVELRDDGKSEPTFVGDVPVWRWRTDFDREPGRLGVTWEIGTAGER